MQKGVVGRKVAWVSTHHNIYATSLYYQSSPPPRCTGPVRVVVRPGGGNIVGLPPPSLRLRDFTHPTVHVRLNCIPLSSHNTIQFWTTGQCMGQSVHCKLLHLLAKQIHHLYLSVETVPQIKVNVHVQLHKNHICVHRHTYEYGNILEKHYI